MTKRKRQLGSLCPQCGYDVKVDEEGCCIGCGSTAIGDGADAAHRWRNKARRAKREAQRG